MPACFTVKALTVVEVTINGVRIAPRERVAFGA